LEKSGAAALNAAMDRPVRENGGGREDEGLEGRGEGGIYFALFAGSMLAMSDS
jgi:hypothetical protein